MGNTKFVELNDPVMGGKSTGTFSVNANSNFGIFDKDVCPTADKLKGIVRVEVWAEGALGDIHLEIKSVSAVSAAALSARAPPVRPPAASETCSGPVQGALRYNISSRTTPETLGAYVEQDEPLAEAVCCDLRTIALAEPRYTFLAPDISLFSKMDSAGVTTFYDSVCGIPLFRAPVNRSLADFQADTQEHGWPSFRPAEVVAGNVMTNKTTGYVTSKCGTHLGSYLPDDKGARWCIDLSCVAGNPQ